MLTLALGSLDRGPASSNGPQPFLLFLNYLVSKFLEGGWQSQLFLGFSRPIGLQVTSLGYTTPHTREVEGLGTSLMRPFPITRSQIPAPLPLLLPQVGSGDHQRF